MRRSILLCLLFCITAHQTFAQINRYVSNAWEEKPLLQNSKDTSEPSTLLKYIVVRDFNRAKADGSDFTHYRTIYKRIRINTRKGADSLAQILIPLEKYEHPVALEARVVNTDGSLSKIKAVRIFLKGKIEAIRLSPADLKPGAEIEYDLTISESDGYAGYESMQSTVSTEISTFMLVLPPDMLYRSKGSNGFPDLQDSIVAGGTHYYHASAYHVPGLLPGDLYYRNNWVQRIEFSPREDYWQQPVKDQFLAYVFIEKEGYKRLEKELSKWPFLKNKMPLPDLVYTIEQQIKSQYILTDNEAFEFSDLATILDTKRCNETGIVKLMASVYYLLGVKSEILFTSAKESLPLDTGVVNIQLANNVLLYFPDLRQALAPASMNTRFPYYPSSWADIWAIRCRDTLIDKKTDVLLDFIKTPVTDYTSNHISLEATLDMTDRNNTVVWLKQTVAGAPSLTVKTIMAETPDSSARKEVYNSLLPAGGPIKVSGLSHKVENDNWDPPVAKAPFILESTFKTDSISIGTMINGLVQQYLSMPPANIPVEMAYAFYQESKITITLPAGYKLSNVKDYIADINGNTLGYKILCKQEDNKVSILALKWYKKAVYTGEEKKVFEKIIKTDNDLKTKKLLISNK